MQKKKKKPMVEEIAKFQIKSETVILIFPFIWIPFLGLPLCGLGLFTVVL